MIVSCYASWRNRVPLSFWSEFYDCPPEKAAGKLAKNPPFQKLFDLSKPILNFNDSGWAYYTLKENADEKMADALMGLLPSSQREEIAFQSERGGYIPDSWFNEDGIGWGMKFSTRVFQRMLRNNTIFLRRQPNNWHYTSVRDEKIHRTDSACNGRTGE